MTTGKAGEVERDSANLCSKQRQRRVFEEKRAMRIFQGTKRKEEDPAVGFRLQTRGASIVISDGVV